MGIAHALSRIAEIQTALAPPRPPAPAAAPTASGSSFANALTLAGAAPGPASATSAPVPFGGPAPAAFGQAPAGTYPHLSGDLDASPELLARLEALAASRGQSFHVTSGHRSFDEQQRLWDNRHSNPFPVARPGSSRHESGRAADVTIGGQPIQNVIDAAELRRFGLAPLAGDAVHVELAG